MAEYTEEQWEGALTKAQAYYDHHTGRGDVFPELPTVPGGYIDKTDDSHWTLNEDNTWTDEEGETRPERFNIILRVFGHKLVPENEYGLKRRGLD